MRLRKNPIYDYEPPKPVIEVEQKPGKRRVILLIVLLTIAAVALGIWIYDMVTVDPGWYTISVETTDPSCANEFSFQYNVGTNGKDAKQEKKAVTQAYTQACVQAYNLFTWDVAQPEAGGIRYLSDRPNQTVTVEKTLYDALALAKDSRLLFMGPITAQYSQIFQYDEDYLAAQCDPLQNPEVMAYIMQLMGFIRSEDHIRLELLGDNQVKLCVSQRYLDFAQANEVENLLDFGWMRNAFVADYLADALMEKGYNQGYLVSFDGFGCYLDGEYTLQVIDRAEQNVYRAATYKVKGATRTVSFRNYPLPNNGLDAWRYYAFDNGRISSVFADPADGLCKSATDNLVCYSKSATCAEMLLSCAPVYLTDALDESALMQLQAEGVFSIWAEGKELRYNEAGLAISPVEDAGYTLRIITE